MKTTIDRAGRIVVPKELRDALGLVAGQPLDIRSCDGLIEIEPLETPVELVDQGFGLVAVPAVDMPPLTAEQVRDALEQLRLSIAVDTSVVIAGFSPWHTSHAAAREVLADRPALPEHCALETFSVPTRLPAPNRMAAGDVARWLAARFDDAYLCLPGDEVARLIRELATDGISGGAAYDALVAATAARADAVLVSLDRRAAITYRRLGVRFRLLPTGESAGPLA